MNSERVRSLAFSLLALSSALLAIGASTIARLGLAPHLIGGGLILVGVLLGIGGVVALVRTSPPS